MIPHLRNCKKVIESMDIIWSPWFKKHISMVIKGLKILRELQILFFSHFCFLSNICFNCFFLCMIMQFFLVSVQWYLIKSSIKYRPHTPAMQGHRDNSEWHHRDRFINPTTTASVYTAVYVGFCRFPSRLGRMSDQLPSRRKRVPRLCRFVAISATNSQTMYK